MTAHDGTPQPGANADVAGGRRGTPGERMARHEAGHPAPARGDASYAALWFGIFGAPAAWSVQSLADYALAAHTCYPGLYPRGTPDFGGLQAVTLAVSLAAVAVGVGAGLLAYREWTRTRGEGGGGGEGSADHAPQGAQQGAGRTGGGSANDRAGRGDADRGGTDRAGTDRGAPRLGGTTNVRAALEIGEGRTRFMAMSGILTSLVFVTASVLHGIAPFLVPPCGT